MSETPNKLKKNLSFFSMISIACGAVIGGWLTESPYWFELTGSNTSDFWHTVSPGIILRCIPGWQKAFRKFVCKNCYYSAQ